MDDPSPRSARLAALALVVSAAVGGVVACVFGAMQWGFLGLSLGLAGAWAFFLLGLAGLYRREQRRAERPPSVTVAVAADASASRVLQS